MCNLKKLGMGQFFIAKCNRNFCENWWLMVHHCGGVGSSRIAFLNKKQA